MTSDRPADVVERRADVLRVLHGSPLRTVDLVDRLDHSRSTVARAVRELTTAGYATRTDEGYRATLHGRLALRERDRLVGRLDDFEASSDLLAALPESFDVPPAVFDDATVVRAATHAPLRPTAPVSDVVDRASHVSIYTSRYVSRRHPIYHEQVVDHGTTATLVLTDDVLQRLLSRRADDLSAWLELGRVAVYRTERRDPVTVVSAETPHGPEMGVVVYEERTPVGFVGNDHPDAVAWADRYVSRAREAADLLYSP
ncbi:MAG: helix-turn-helix transcriptional regulator [Haloplanus sp.]